MLFKIGLSIAIPLVLFFRFIVFNDPAIVMDVVHYEKNTDEPILDTVYDASRDRMIPFMMNSAFSDEANYKGMIIFSHGYANNRPDAYLSYSYLLDGLRSRGYFVVSIQHELKNDPVLPLNGNMTIVRKPFWENGARNIEKVYQRIIEINPNLSDLPIILVGHSNGGDQSAYYCRLHPNQIYALITLDNLRFNLTQIEVQKQLSIRSNDRLADSIVFENWDKRKTHYFQIDTVQVKHADMNDKGSINDKKEILRLLFDFLKD